MGDSPAQIVTIDSHSGIALVSQIEHQIRAKVDSGALTMGARLPSIRRLSHSCSVSTATVVDAYNRLVASGYLEARRASGFFVGPRNVARRPGALFAVTDFPVGSSAALLRAYEETPFNIHAGSGWLPENWLFGDGVKAAMRAVSRTSGGHLVGYGHPYGYPPLRQAIVRQLATQGIEAHPDQVILTTGASHALMLLINLLVRPGETVLCDDPAYGNLIALLRQRDARIIGVPRTPQGPDTEALARLALEHRPKVFFTSSALQNPTGTSCGPSVAYRILQTAERCDFLIVEDDIFSDLQEHPTQSLASLDGLRRVIYVQSFSKSIAPSLRVGYVACEPGLAKAFLQWKAYASLSTSELNERIVVSILAQGNHRKHLDHLRSRLQHAQESVCLGFRNAGMRVFHEPQGGMFVWARFERDDLDSEAVVLEALRNGIVLSPGSTYAVDGRPSPWFRFNAARSDDAQLYRFLERVAAKA
jgi:DNA-binding transcriptional MocR family regulator